MKLLKWNLLTTQKQNILEMKFQEIDRNNIEINSEVVTPDFILLK